MIKIWILIGIYLCISEQKSHAQDNPKLMFYNLLEFPEEETFANRILNFEVIMGDYRPDLFMVCEFNNQDGANLLLNTLQSINPHYNRASFQNNTSDDDFGDSNQLQQLIFYDSSKLILDNQAVVTTIFRDFNHYQLKPNTPLKHTKPAVYEVIVCHLKAASGYENEQLRLQMINDLENHIDAFSPDSKIILAGDLNLYSATEPGFQELISINNNITFIDPAEKIGNWHNNVQFIDVVTQSTRTQSGLGASNGGFDDKFDFILSSQNMATSTDLSFVENSYNVYGNNENTDCYNRSIKSKDCAVSEFSQLIETSLYNFSNHLPVTLNLKTDRLLSINEFTTTKGLKIKGPNIVDGVLRLQNISAGQFKTRLYILNSLGQALKTIIIENSLYINIKTKDLANGLYYCILADQSQEPLKFIVAH